ncbi:hypothetical protein HB371_18395 [Acinetobacter baumannii]|uniref:hypothetical protein n=1 Tax=Acinetobacter baumannii TaxID=470 RepID=UPI001459F99F|nr:hypothetical protein [Acinetobacter baumannii]NLZ23941.1 hypothetical protein [Acinetobacter baumannii]
MDNLIHIFNFFLIIWFFHGPICRFIRNRIIDKRDGAAMRATASLSGYVEKYGLKACYVDSSQADYRVNKSKLPPATRKAVDALENIEFNTRQYIFYVTDGETKELIAHCYRSEDGQLLKYKVKLSPKSK